jgi:hypothetical protein
MARKQGSIEFENNPQVSKLKHEEAALAAIAAQHPEYQNVQLLGEGGQMGGTQRRAEFTYDTAEDK